MADAADFRNYIRVLQDNLSRGNATEHTHRSALEQLLESVVDGIKATNEPKRVACGAPDYVVTGSGQNAFTIGYVEAKDIGISLEDIERDAARTNPSTANGQQFKRYLNSLPNLILTNYTEFRCYLDGKRREAATLANIENNRLLSISTSGINETWSLLSDFLSQSPEPVAAPDDLARRMARLSQIIRDVVQESFATGQVSQDLSELHQAFKQTLVPDLEPDDFADMFAQTLAYGLFAARVNRASGEFRRQDAAFHIPPTNPFIQQIFSTVAGPRLDQEPFVSFVDDLTQLLRNADMAAVLQDFGKRAGRQDPVMHFYETFLAAYDPKLRQRRGVYYTPEPVISYIVRSVDQLLRYRFGCPEGLADHSLATYESLENDRPVQKQSHRVLVLDPACGTGSFIYAVIDHIREHYRNTGRAGMWDGYVKDHLLKRLFGFELLMAPYAMAHLKLGMQLAALDIPEDEREGWAYGFGLGERLGVFLTNALDAGELQQSLPGPYRIIAQEANSATEIKRDMPIMVVLGNPPYSGHSANASRRGNELTWIGELIEDYKQVDGVGLGERNPRWLQDDYVKFIRFGQWRIKQTGTGILAFITNHSYLDNPTFRGMRQQLMDTFSDIYLLDLHGNARRKESAPDGGPDKNVFDIRQGVAIALLVKEAGKEGPSVVHHADLWGTREAKYAALAAQHVATIQWEDIEPVSPNYLFKPWNNNLEQEYGQWPRITEVMPVNTSGIVTGQDAVSIAYSRTEILDRVRDFPFPEGQAMNEELVTPILYRPFDTRHTYYSRRFITRHRHRGMRHILAGENISLVFMRQVAVDDDYSHFVVARDIVDNRSFYSSEGIMKLAPLYVYPSEQEIAQGLYQRGERQPNLAPDFTTNLAGNLGLQFIPDGRGDLQETLGPENVLYYIYAIFHSPAYRKQYDQFLRVDFPRVPLTDDLELFRVLAGLGSELASAHLLESPGLRNGAVGFPVAGDNIVARAHPKYYAPGEVPPGNDGPLERGRVYISANGRGRQRDRRAQYFDGVNPQMWAFQMGGYQPMQKWLKDRVGRTLSFDDQDHYCRMAAAMGETIRLMAQVDAAIADSASMFPG